MWLSGHQKIPAQKREGQTGTVTMAGQALAIQLDGEIRNPKVFGPAGYCWVPETGQQVLVIKNEGERPVITGTDLKGKKPLQVTISAGQLNLEGDIRVNGVELDAYIAGILKRSREETM